MASRKVKHRRPAAGRPKRQPHAGESRASEATTVGWTVSVTTVLLCDIAAVAAHLYARWYPTARGVAVLRELLLFAAAVIGFFSLAMLPAVFRLRRERPPSGFTVFAICVAVAPILAIIVRNMR